MARALLRFGLKDDEGNAISNARLYLLEEGTTTPASGAWTAKSGGASLTSVVSDANGQIEVWFDDPRLIDIKVTDNGDTAYLAPTSQLVNWADFTKTVPVVASSADSTSTDLYISDFAVNATQLAVLGNGASKPLSNYYVSLAAAQVDYPHATALTDQLDWAVGQAAINAAVTQSKRLAWGPGTYYRGTNTFTTAAVVGNLTILGAGPTTRITALAGSITSTFSIALTGASNVILSDLTIEGPTGLAFDNGTHGVIWISGGLTHTFTVTRVTITGTHDHGILNSGGGTVRVDHCYIESTDVSVAMFESTNAVDAGGATFSATGGKWSTPNGDLTSAGSVGLYIHPHIPYILTGVTFKTFGRYGVYQNGSPGNARAYAICSGCSFIGCEVAQTKSTGPSLFTGCQVSGTSSNLGSSLGGIVTFTNCAIEDNILIYGPITPSHITITDCTFLNAQLQAGGGASHANYQWQIRNCTFRVNESWTRGNSPIIRTVGGRLDVDTCNFFDDTTAATYQAFILIASNTPAVRVNGVKTRTCRASLAGIYMDQGTLTLQNCDFDTDASASVSIATGVAANSVEGANNALRGTSLITGSATTQQRLTRRPGVNPTSIASAAIISTATTAMFNFDTHVVTGAATIDNLSNPFYCTGTLKLVVATGATWATSAAGNLLPLTVAARTAGTVVVFVWEPIAAKWIEQ